MQSNTAAGSRTGSNDTYVLTPLHFTVSRLYSRSAGLTAPGSALSAIGTSQEIVTPYQSPSSSRSKSRLQSPSVKIWTWFPNYFNV